ncbi:FkbM family methyltransferase [Thalassobaculum sp.]|uniref:FkbM family methyltransferase n=1 Tax=Thalassobaculum sp. TaxID=2022740 RepID=UPI003B5C755D
MSPTLSEPAKTIAGALANPGHPVALASLLGLARSRHDMRRSLKVLRWLARLGVPAESVARQTSILSRIDRTLRHRDAVAAQTGPFKTLTVPGLGDLKFSTAADASRAFLDLVERDGPGYEPGVLRYLVAAGRRGEVVADIGAHVGYYTTVLGAAGAKVIACEMHPDLLLEVKRNLWANELDRAHVLNVAVGNYDGLIFNIRFNPTPGLRVEDPITTAPPDAFEKALYDPVPCLRLDTLFAREGSVPDLVKIDIEGYEFEALKGASNLIASGRTRFLIEFHPHAVTGFGHQPADIVTMFPATWRREVLEDDGTLRPLDPTGADLVHDPKVENIKLLFSPPGHPAADR